MMSVFLPALNDPYHIDVVAHLIKKGLKINAIATHSSTYIRRKKEFRGVQLFDEQTFQYADKLETIDLSQTEPLDEKTLHSFTLLENLFLSISDRLCFYPKTVRERKHIFKTLLRFWLSYLKRSKPSAILFLYIPHLGYDNVIYGVAKYLKIPTLLLKDTIYHKVLLTEEFGNAIQKVPATYLKNKSKAFIQQYIGKELLDVFYKNNDLINFNKQLNVVTLQQQNRGLFRSLMDLQSLSSFVALLHNPFHRAEGSMLYLEKETSWLHYYWMLILYYWKSKKLFGYYHTLTTTPKHNEQFLYFPLHYQPERTTMPEAGVFEDQLLVLDILSKSLPKGWKIYVKEHPSQLCRSDPRKMNFRDKSFYTRIVAHRNVRLLSIDKSSEQLIQNSAATVTMTGSAGWEALLLGKPVILFSESAWYAACNSCYNVNSLKTCRLAIKSIMKSSPKKVMLDVLKYLSFYKNTFIPGAFASEFIQDSPIPYAEMVEGLASAIFLRLQTIRK